MKISLFILICCFICVSASHGGPSNVSVEEGEVGHELLRSKKMKLVDCSWLWDKSSIQLLFGEEGGDSALAVVLVNSHRQKIDYPTIQGQVIELYFSKKGFKGEKELVISGGQLEAKLISMLENISVLKSDSVTKGNIDSCINALRNRDQSWDQIKSNFVINQKFIEDRINDALKLNR